MDFLCAWYFDNRLVSLWRISKNILSDRCDIHVMFGLTSHDLASQKVQPRHDTCNHLIIWVRCSLKLSNTEFMTISKPQEHLCYFVLIKHKKVYYSIVERYYIFGVLVDSSICITQKNIVKQFTKRLIIMVLGFFCCIFLLAF